MEERNCIGIIAEFDPFHRGHAHLIAQAKAALPGAPVVCAMSGPFTQRGEAAIVSKYARAEMALSDAGRTWWWNCPSSGRCPPPSPSPRGAFSSSTPWASPTWPLAVRAATCPPYGQWPRALDSPAFSAALRPHLQQGLPSPAPDRRRWKGWWGKLPHLPDPAQQPVGHPYPPRHPDLGAGAGGADHSTGGRGP